MNNNWDSMNKYKFWIEDDYFDEVTKKELLALKDDFAEIEDRFFRELEFGTGGMRGILGAGTNRMNIYTVRKVTQGLSEYLLAKFGKEARERGVVIAYDCRRKSYEFAVEAASVLTGNGIKTYLFDELRPTPELSFAVRHLRAAGGVVVTASHNPKEYNGYKVYGNDGAQLSVDDSKELEGFIYAIDDFSRINLAPEAHSRAAGLLVSIGRDIDDEYIASLKSLTVYPEVKEADGDAMSIKIVYTPLHGAGSKPVMRLLHEAGFSNISIVKEQQSPDPEFSTLVSPNPEDPASFKLATGLAKADQAELILATDPDSDRLGVMIKTPENEYMLLSGNQTGCLLADYILAGRRAHGSLPSDSFIIKTVVTTELARIIGQSYGVGVVEVLTGFKFIGEKIKQLDEFGSKKFIFGFEESIGFLTGTHVRDKDGVSTALMVCEMAAWYRMKGITLYEALERLCARYGYSYNNTINKYLPNDKNGIAIIEDSMKKLRDDWPYYFKDLNVRAVRDYASGTKLDLAAGNSTALGLPRSNVLYFELENNGWVCFRPSGTEPKIKVYYEKICKSGQDAYKSFKCLDAAVKSIIDKLF